MKTVYFFINGIRTRPGDDRNWNNKAVTHVHNWNRAGHVIVAERIEYFTYAILRPIYQRARARKLAKTASHYDKSWRRVVVAHSNGADVMVDCFANNPNMWANEVHLVSAACEADFNKNGLNASLAAGRIKRLTVYIGTEDLPLRLARCFVARTILGYGTLGLDGPLNVDREHLYPSDGSEPRVFTRRWTGFGHSDCWLPENFGATMENFR